MSAQPIPTKPAPHAELAALTRKACQLAQTAAASAAEAVVKLDEGRFDAVAECERELDHIDREMDERAPNVLPGLTGPEARELLGCVKFVIDLERIGDLVSSFAGRARAVGRQLDPCDVQDLSRMAALLERSLADVSAAYAERDLDRAIAVLRADAEIDRQRNLIFIRHVECPAAQAESIQVLLMAQALERAGDHAKNLAEEVCHLVSGHTVRHVLRMHDKPLEQMFLDSLRRRKG